MPLSAQCAESGPPRGSRPRAAGRVDEQLYERRLVISIEYASTGKLDADNSIIEGNENGIRNLPSALCSGPDNGSLLAGRPDFKGRFRNLELRRHRQHRAELGRVNDGQPNDLANGCDIL